MFGLINKEFVEQHFANSRRSLLRSEFNADVRRGKSQKQLGVVYIVYGFALLGYRKKVVDVQREQNWTENGLLGHTHCQWERVG